MDVLDPRLALELAAVAYAPDEGTQASNEGWRELAASQLGDLGYELERSYFANDCVAFLSRRRFGHRHYVVSVRGTDSPYDWFFTNFDFFWMRGPLVLDRFGRMRGRSRVRRGFGKHARSISHDFGEALRDARDDGYPIHLCGHSAGGSIAAILAGYLWSNGTQIPVQSITTFGASRAVDRDLALQLNGEYRYRDRDGVLTSRVQRYTQCGDVVPHTPPYFAGWTHYGQERYVDSGGNIYNRSLDRSWRLHDWYVSGAWKSPSTWIQKHAIDSYRAALNPEPKIVVVAEIPPES